VCVSVCVSVYVCMCVYLRAYDCVCVCLLGYVHACVCSSDTTSYLLCLIVCAMCCVCLLYPDITRDPFSLLCLLVCTVCVPLPGISNSCGRSCLVCICIRVLREDVSDMRACR
jgi:hypothetical protein